MIQIVQHRSAAVNNATGTTTLAFASPNVAGNLLVYCCGTGVNSVTLSAATDNNTNIIAPAVSVTGGAGNGQNRIDYVANCHAGANTVTLNSSAITDDLHIHIWEISGLLQVSPLDQTGSVASSATASVATSAPTTVLQDFVIAVFHDFALGPTLVEAAPYDPSELSNVGGSTGSSMLSEVLIANTLAIQTATCTGNGTDVMDQTIAAFKGISAHLLSCCGAGA